MCAFGVSAEMDSGTAYPELTAEMYGSLSNATLAGQYFYFPQTKIMVNPASTNIQYMIRPVVGAGPNLSVDCNGFTVLR
jgi:hypothetical protein